MVVNQEAWNSRSYWQLLFVGQGRHHRGDRPRNRQAGSDLITWAPVSSCACYSWTLQRHEPPSAFFVLFCLYLGWFDLGPATCIQKRSNKNTEFFLSEAFTIFRHPLSICQTYAMDGHEEFIWAFKQGYSFLIKKTINKKETSVGWNEGRLTGRGVKHMDSYPAPATNHPKIPGPVSILSHGLSIPNASMPFLY